MVGKVAGLICIAESAVPVHHPLTGVFILSIGALPALPWFLHPSPLHTKLNNVSGSPGINNSV